VEKNISSVEMMRCMITDLQVSNAEAASANVMMVSSIPLGIWLNRQ